jgi:hypothetical protein
MAIFKEFLANFGPPKEISLWMKLYHVFRPVI